MTSRLRLAAVRERAAAEAKRAGQSTIRPAHLLAAIEQIDADEFERLFGSEATSRVRALLGPDGHDFGRPVEAAETTQLLSQAEASEGIDTLINLLRPLLAPGDASPLAVQDQQTDKAEAARAASVEQTSSIDDLMARLDGLVGLLPVKQQVLELIDVKRLAKIRSERGLPAIDGPNHLVFTGNPGTGKTTIARIIASVYATLGIVSQGSFREVSRADLVGGYVGQTALKTRDVVMSSIGGVLFIDEAYSLSRSGDSIDYGLEAIDELGKLMEDHRSDLAVIAAGYPREMQQFLNSNPGLRSRFGRVIDFPDYSTDELVSIFCSLCDEAELAADDDLVAAVRALLDAAQSEQNFGNGRYVREVFKHIVGRQAVRLSVEEELSDDSLRLLRREDLAIDARATEEAGSGVYL
jgi:SpoVK/Ycf46/Vps4 family AAA+-type ATPase